MLLDIFAFVVILTILAVVIWLVTLLGPLPGKIAEQRNHHQKDAIKVLGWIGLITMGPGWLIALVWAYLRSEPSSDRMLKLEERITQLEQQLEQKQGKTLQGGNN